MMGTMQLAEMGNENSGNLRAIDRAWVAIFHDYKIGTHDFSKAPFLISAEMIRKACRHFARKSEKEIGILCRQNTRENRPCIFADKEIFILPLRNRHYILVRGEGYIDIPPITSKVIVHKSVIDFLLCASAIGDSAKMHLDYAYAVGMVQSFVGDDSLLLTIRGKKLSPSFSFRAGNFNIKTEDVQTKIDVYEGREQIVLVDAKNAAVQNTIIRQLYYPYRQWSHHAQNRKKVSTIFFTRQEGEYHFWQFGFDTMEDYNSIRLIKSARYRLA